MSCWIVKIADGKSGGGGLTGRGCQLESATLVERSGIGFKMAVSQMARFNPSDYSGDKVGVAKARGP